jgi:peroxiredoxin
VIGVDPETDDTADILDQFAAQTGAEFPLGWDLNNSYNEYRAAGGEGISPYPLDVVIDKTGVVRYVSREYNAGETIAIIEQVLAE